MEEEVVTIMEGIVIAVAVTPTTAVTVMEGVVAVEEETTVSMETWCAKRGCEQNISTDYCNGWYLD
jgi:hypothetical protein